MPSEMGTVTGVQTVNDIINRIGQGFIRKQPIWGEAQTAGTTNWAGNTFSGLRVGDTLTIPSLETGVSAYIPTCVDVGCSVINSGILVAKVINLGSFDIGAASAGVFTDGSAMPNQNVGGVAVQTFGGVLLELTTATAGTQTAITITYNNQDGASSTAPAFTPTTSVAARSIANLVLATGDIGVQDITAISRVSSAGPTGVIQCWGIIPLSFMAAPVNIAPGMNTDNLVTSALNLQRLGAGDKISAFVFGSIGAKAVSGIINFIGDK